MHNAWVTHDDALSYINHHHTQCIMLDDGLILLWCEEGCTLVQYLVRKKYPKFLDLSFSTCAVQTISLEGEESCTFLQLLVFKKYLNRNFVSFSTSLVLKNILCVIFYMYGSNKKSRRWRSISSFFVIIRLIKLNCAGLQHLLHFFGKQNEQLFLLFY